MQDTALRLDKVQEAWIRAKNKAQVGTKIRHNFGGFSKIVALQLFVFVRTLLVQQVCRLFCSHLVSSLLLSMPPSFQALGAHSKKLTVELDEKAVSLAVAQASQELALRSAHF